MAVTVVELVNVALGRLVCAVPSLVHGATAPPIAITSVALVVAAAGLALWRPGARWLTGAGVGLGALLGNLVRRKVPWPAVGGLGLVTLALGVAAVAARATASDIIRAEALALNKVAALVGAQREFRAAHPLRG